MNKFENLNIERPIHQILQLNPFDAVVIVEKDRENQFSVVQSNDKAQVLFSSSLDNRAAEQFFGECLWQEFEQGIQQHSNSIFYVTIPSSKRLAVSIQHMDLLGFPIFVFVIREITMDMMQQDTQSEEAVKHLYSVEHYVDPVISLDTNGTIIYTNIAATNQLSQQGVSVLGENILSFVESNYKEEVIKLFNNTLEGYPLGMPECRLHNALFSMEPVYIKTFPTYWDGNVIGAHFIFKNANQFFQEQQMPSFLAYQDELTSLYNRRALNDHWATTFEKRSEKNVALILVDLDRFKKFNESLGKQKADGMLVQVSNRFKQLRSKLLEVYRYNGDEFVFLLQYETQEDIDALAQRIFNCMNEAIVVDEQEYYITLSVGICTTSPNERIELDEMLHRADQALFFVKQNGRNHFRYYLKEMTQTFPNEALMEAHLRRAIEFNEFSIHFQPQVDLATNKIESFEALLRWNNRKFGNVPPSQFIPLAESSGIILEIGDWVFEQVCNYLKMWKEEGYRKVRIAVNISPRQFKQDIFVAKITRLIKSYEIDARCLELEITEGSMTDAKETTFILTQLKKLGVYISVDDFGTGYSSLSYLKIYPIDILKIDQSFIADIQKDDKNEAIVKAILAMSKNLGLEVIAEGVEERHQEQFLIDHQCEKVQGYLYDRPLPVDKMVQQYLAI